VIEEFKRYFDIGAFHKDQQDVLRPFSQAEYEGIKYMVNESRYLIENGHFSLIPQQFVRLVAKYAGYKLGWAEKTIPLSLKRSMSMHSTYWQ
jgi:rhamnosyltransferase